jgi:hypothetical protein
LKVTIYIYIYIYILGRILSLGNSRELLFSMGLI